MEVCLSLLTISNNLVMLLILSLYYQYISSGYTSSKIKSELEGIASQLLISSNIALSHFRN